MIRWGKKRDVRFRRKMIRWGKKRDVRFRKKRDVRRFLRRSRHHSTAFSLLQDSRRSGKSMKITSGKFISLCGGNHSSHVSVS